MIKDIPGYEGLYSVDDCGNVHSSYRGGRILSGVKHHTAGGMHWRDASRKESL